MNTQQQLLNTVTPLTIFALAFMPFILFPSLREKNEEIKQITYNSIFCYLVILGMLLIGLITLDAIEVMGTHSGPRALFITAILLIACFDKVIDLVPQMAFVKTNLIKRLAYFVTILCSIPLLWQILLWLVPESHAADLKLMTTLQIVLMLTFFALGVINFPAKKQQ